MHLSKTQFFSLAGLILLAACAFPLSVLSAETATSTCFKLRDVIPTGRTTVELLQVRFSPRAEELARKLSSVMATNQDWLTAYIKSNAEAGPLPYHTNFGLSKAEWKEYLEESDKSRHLTNVAEAYVIFRHRGEC